MKINAILICLVSILTLGFPEDLKVKDKIFISRANSIQSLYFGVNGTAKYAVFRFKKKLDSKLSKGKATDEIANYGDSASTYCYKKESEISGFEKEIS